VASPSFSLVRPSEQVFADQATYQSTLEAIVNVPLAAEIDGRIVAIPVQEGEMVKVGALLFRLDQLQQQATVDTTRAEARKDRLNAERYIFLNSQGAVSTRERDFYVTQAIASADALRSSEATLAYKNVRAPIAGMVGNVIHKLGSVVRKGETIVNIVDNQRLWLRLDVPGELAYRVRLGQSVELQAPDQTPLKATGKVTFIAPSLDRSRQTLLVKATFDNPDAVLRDQQRVRATLRFASDRSLAIPQGAMVLQAGQTFVFKAVSAPEAERLLGHPLATKPPPGALVAVQTPVTLGSLQSGRFAVAKGLASSDQVVLGNLAQLRSGMVLPASR
jgi:RND family efflux transporter MFP subunit